MPFESQWSRIPLAVRWGVSFFVAIVLIVLLVEFVTHNNSNGEARMSAKGLREQQKVDYTLMQQDQAPHTVRITAGATAALAKGIRADMNRAINQGTIDGPIEWVRCGRDGAHGARVGYHCLAKIGGIKYPFLAVAQHHAVTFCKRDYPEIPSQNVPVSPRCRL